MKKLLFIDALSKDGVKEEIAKSLNETRIQYTIPDSKLCIIVEGSNDAVRAATIAIRELGYEVK